MEEDILLVNHIAKTFYNLTPEETSVSALCGYSDKNFLFSSESNKFVLKIVYEKSETVPELTDIIDEILERATEYSNTGFIIPAFRRTIAGRISALATLSMRTSDASHKELECNIKLTNFFPGKTLIQFVNEHENLYESEKLYENLGKLTNQLNCFFKSNYHLVEQLKRIRIEQKFPWQTMTSIERIDELKIKFFPAENHERRILLEKVIEEYKQNAESLAKLPEYVIHGDLSGNNILVNPAEAEKFCLIDFQDVQVAPQFVELAVLILYCVLEQKKIDLDDALIVIPAWIVQGFNCSSYTKLTRKELALIPIVMKLRLSLSLLNGKLAHEKDENNDYVLQTNIRGWYLLKLLVEDPTVGDSSYLLRIWLKQLARKQ